MDKWYKKSNPSIGTALRVLAPKVCTKILEVMEQRAHELCFMCSGFGNLERTDRVIHHCDEIDCPVCNPHQTPCFICKGIGVTEK